MVKPGDGKPGNGGVGTGKVKLNRNFRKEKMEGRKEKRDDDLADCVKGET